MGLDMYLKANKYVGRKDWKLFKEMGEIADSFNEIPERKEFKQIVEASDITKLINDDTSGISISFGIGYWRKANAIHNWFVNTCANGIDNCQEVYIPRHSLNALRDTCQLVLKEKNDDLAMEFLPPVNGFFFGGQELDEWYWNSLKYTVDLLNEVLALTDDFDFTYQASW